MGQSNEQEITSTTGAGLFFKSLFVFKAQILSSSELSICFCIAEDRQKDKSVVEVVFCSLLRRL